MTDDIKRLRELLAKATSGPWEWWNSGKYGVTAIKEHDPGDEKGNLFACGGDRSTDAALIAEMRNALPALLDMAERCARYEAALRQVRELSRDREAFVAQGPRAWATAERITDSALAESGKKERT